MKKVWYHVQGHKSKQEFKRWSVCLNFNWILFPWNHTLWHSLIVYTALCYHYSFKSLSLPLKGCSSKTGKVTPSLHPSNTQQCLFTTISKRYWIFSLWFCSIIFHWLLSFNQISTKPFLLWWESTTAWNIGFVIRLIRCKFHLHQLISWEILNTWVNLH